MKERTVAEYVNNKIIHNYSIKICTPRGKKISFLTMITGFNIHLDAQVKYLESTNKFNFIIIFNIKSIARHNLLKI